MSLLHSDEISTVLAELKITAQQSTIAVASLQELIANAEQTRQKADALLLKLQRIADGLLNAGKP